MKVSIRCKKVFDYYASISRSSKICEDSLIVVYNIQIDLINGHSALECFYSLETYGKNLPCKEPHLLAHVMQHKRQRGITVNLVAEDFAINRIVFSKEIKENYPPDIANEIFSQSEKIALNKLGYVPTFVKNRKDFSEYDKIEIEFTNPN